MPGARGIQRHELDETETEILAPGKLGERLDLVIVEAADHDGVGLDRVQPQFLRQVNAGQHRTEAVPPGDLLEVGRVERVEAEADALQSGLPQRARLLREEESVGGHGQI